MYGYVCRFHKPKNFWPMQFWVPVLVILKLSKILNFYNNIERVAAAFARTSTATFRSRSSSPSRPSTRVRNQHACRHSRRHQITILESHSGKQHTQWQTYCTCQTTSRDITNDIILRN